MLWAGGRWPTRPWWRGWRLALVPLLGRLLAVLRLIPLARSLLTVPSARCGRRTCGDGLLGLSSTTVILPPSAQDEHEDQQQEQEASQGGEEQHGDAAVVLADRRGRLAILRGELVLGALGVPRVLGCSRLLGLIGFGRLLRLLPLLGFGRLLGLLGVLRVLCRSGLLRLRRGGRARQVHDHLEGLGAVGVPDDLVARAGLTSGHRHLGAVVVEPHLAADEVQGELVEAQLVVELLGDLLVRVEREHPDVPFGVGEGALGEQVGHQGVEGLAVLGPEGGRHPLVLRVGTVRLGREQGHPVELLADVLLDLLLEELLCGPEQFGCFSVVGDLEGQRGRGVTVDEHGVVGPDLAGRQHERGDRKEQQRRAAHGLSPRIGASINGQLARAAGGTCRAAIRPSRAATRP